MPACLHPKQISIKSVLAENMQVFGAVSEAMRRYKSLRPYSFNSIYVPCGKCINCLKTKQANTVLRTTQEMKKRGKVSFITLTYDDEHLPIAQSFFKEDKDGVEIQLADPEIVYNARSSEIKEYLEFCRNDLLEQTPSELPRFVDWDLFPQKIDGERYFVRVTPSICREDVRLWIKSSRIAYQRKYNRSLPEWSYTLCCEYGPRTCRPHYHLVFCGLDMDIVQFFLYRWTYGFTKVSEIHPFNKDGSDAYCIASRYIGKYMSKGKFQCDSVCANLAEKPRVCRSRAFGVDFPKALVGYIACFNMFGEYDIDTLRLKSTNELLTEDQVKKIVAEIPHRLSYSPDGKYYYPIPRIIRERIFCYACRVPKKISVNGKTVASYSLVYRPSTIWALVQDYIRTVDDDLRRREFEIFCSENSSRSLSECCRAFKEFNEVGAFLEEKARTSSLLTFYQKSKF